MSEQLVGHDYPCEPLRDLQKRVDSHEVRLAEGTTNFAVINTKLNLIMWVMGTICVAVVGAIVKYLFMG